MFKTNLLFGVSETLTVKCKVNVQLMLGNFSLFQNQQNQSFKGIIHSQGHIGRETQMKTTVFVIT